MLENKENLYIFFHTISGAAAAAVSTLLVYPIENIKIRMQNMYKTLLLKNFS